MKSIRFCIIALSITSIFFTSCTKQSINPPPNIVVSAGPSQTIQSDSVILTGKVISGQSSNLLYSWTLIVGPNNPIILDSTSLTATAIGLVSGTYIFQFEASNSTATIIGEDTVTCVIVPPTTKTLALNPSNNPLEGRVDNYYNVFGTAPNFIMGAWTIGGTPVEWRSYITFDQSGIPNGATITGATLYLYQTAEPTIGPSNGGTYATADNYGGANAYHIRQVTSSWTPSTMTWDNQPSNSLTDEVIMPQTNNAFENDTLNVTALVKDIQASSNYGLEMGLENETFYNVRNYSTSYVSDTTLHPKLIITYY